MELRLLGAVEAHTADGKIPLGGPKQRALLAILALEPNTPVATDRLIESLWGEEPPPSAPKMVQLYVSHLRKALAGTGAEIVTRGRGYELDIEPDCVDAVRFERLVAEAVQADGRAGELAEQALTLWRGPPLHDVADEPFAAAAIRRLEDVHLRAREVALEAALETGDADRVLPEIEVLVARHPLRERLHELRMFALYRAGRQAEALEAYRHARAVLVEEVGIEPGPALRDLHERILRQDPELGGRRRPIRSAAAGRRRTLLALAAALAALAPIAVFAVMRLTDDDDLGRIEGGTVGVINPGDGRILEDYRVGSRPGALAAGGGSVWAASPDDGTVSRIDRSRAEVVTIPIGGEPTALAFGEGSLWVTEGESRRVVQVDPRTNRVARRRLVGNAPRGVAVGHGAVWVTSAVDGRVDRIDLAGRPTRRSSIAGGPTAVAVGADAVWVAGEQSGSVVRLDPRSGAALRTVAVGNGPAAIVVGAGAVWVANREDGTVSRIDPRTSSVTGTVRVGGRPGALALGDGALWVGDGHGEAVVRVDQQSLRVERRVAIGSAPSSFAFADGRLWSAALPGAAAHRGGTLRFGLEVMPLCGCLDPVEYDTETWLLASLVYDGLVGYRRVGGAASSTLVPNLATSVPAAQDAGRTYVFELRRGLRFADGSAVRASDFRASMERLLRIAPSLPPFFETIVGARECTRRDCSLARGIQTDDAARTITIRLTEPDPELVHKLAMPLASVVPAGSPMRRAKPPLHGTGPYRVASLDPERGARLVRNPHFRSWSQAARPDGFPDAIELAPGTDAQRHLAAVREGSQDAIAIGGPSGLSVGPRQARAIGLRSAGRAHSALLPSTVYLFLNARERPFDDVRVRRALNYAIDRRRVARSLGGATAASITCQFVAPGLAGYEPRCPYTRSPSAAGGWTGPDMARARRLVARSGTRGTRVTVRGFEPFGPAVRHATAVLRELGFRTRAHIFEDSGQYFGFVSDARNRSQIGATAWFPDWLTPSSFLLPVFGCRLYDPRGGANLSRYCDPELDRLGDRAAKASGTQANALWARADARVVAAAPAVPLVNFRTTLIVSDRVGNAQHHPQLGPLLDQMWVR